MNGWKNYETWNAYNWLTNEYSSVKWLEQEAADALENADGDKDAAASALSDIIEEAVKNGAPDLNASLYLDLLTYSIEQIDFYEIAQAFYE